MAIQVIPNKKPVRKLKPHYLLVLDYMIGDADGDTEKEMQVSLDNPHIERFVKILRKLGSTRKHGGGIQLDEWDVHEAIPNRITQAEYDFIAPLMFGDEETDQEDTEFGQVVDTYYAERYTSLTAVNLLYVDKNGIKHRTKFVKDKK